MELFSIMKSIEDIKVGYMTKDEWNTFRFEESWQEELNIETSKLNCIVHLKAGVYTVYLYFSKGKIEEGYLNLNDVVQRGTLLTIELNKSISSTFYDLL